MDIAALCIMLALQRRLQRWRKSKGVMPGPYIIMMAKLHTVPP
jgi:hypothetical protein